ncbi:MAG: hypothetical protein HZB65_04095 [Candidatus Aenigmarchaeota archaeon]|nr:hypothetical protein [Candidatus Aenigmarchaeota archaeon]
MTLLITDADFDGIVSAMLLRYYESSLSEIDFTQIRFAHPTDIQKKCFQVNEAFVIADLPYLEGAKMWFDHHKNNFFETDVSGRRSVADSCASVIADYYGIDDHAKLISETDRIDSGRFSREDILNPSGCMLLSLLIGSDHDFNRHVISLLKEYDIDSMMKDEQISLKILDYKTNLSAVCDYFYRHIQVKDNVIILDMRDTEESIYLDSAWKFLHYAMHPECNVSVRIYHPNLDRSKTKFQFGCSILNSTYTGNLAELAGKYDGGGHPRAAGFTIGSQRGCEIYDYVIAELIRPTTDGV